MSNHQKLILLTGSLHASVAKVTKMVKSKTTEERSKELGIFSQEKRRQ